MTQHNIDMSVCLSFGLVFGLFSGGVVGWAITYDIMRRRVRKAQEQTRMVQDLAITRLKNILASLGPKTISEHEADQNLPINQFYTSGMFN